jgi:hypothetical protein
MLKETPSIIAITEINITFAVMVPPEYSCLLDKLWIDTADSRAWRPEATYILPQHSRHELYAIICHHLMHLFLIHPEV